MATENVGYSTIGGTNFNFGVDGFGIYSIPLGYSVCAIGGVTDTIKARVKRSGGSGTCTMIGGIWESDTILGYTSEITFSSTSYAWRTLTLTAPVELEAGHWYMIGVGVKYLSPNFVISGHTSGGVGFEQEHANWPPTNLTNRFGNDIFNVYAISEYGPADVSKVEGIEPGKVEGVDWWNIVKIS